MTRALVFCALACGVASPAISGERNAATIASKLPVQRSALLTPDPAPAVGAMAPLRLPRASANDFVVRVHAQPERIATRTAFETLPIQAAAHFTIRDVRTPMAWRVTDESAAVTASDNGNYAVRDALADHRKPRAFRSSPLNATLMLRLDGNDDSPPLSVGGGGVAAVLWKAMPQ